MITFDDVHKSFGAHEVLKGINAEIAKGQVVCLI
ncbi:MAG: glutamine ABC transporter ATP-binding protein GlnQ, partial [Mesorhizobium sp.]